MVTVPKSFNTIVCKRAVETELKFQGPAVTLAPAPTQ